MSNIYPLDFTGIGNPIIAKTTCGEVYANEFNLWYPIDGFLSSNDITVQVTEPVTKTTTLLTYGTDYVLMHPVLTQVTPEDRQYYSCIKLLKKDLVGELMVRCYTMGGNWVIDDGDINEFLSTYYLNTDYIAISHANPKVYSNFKLDLSTPQGITDSFLQYGEIHIGVCYIKKLAQQNTGGGGGSGGGTDPIVPTGASQLFCSGYKVKLEPGVPLLLPHNLDKTIINYSLVTPDGFISDLILKNIGDGNTVELYSAAPNEGVVYLYYIK